MHRSIIKDRSMMMRSIQGAMSIPFMTLVKASRAGCEDSYFSQQKKNTTKRSTTDSLSKNLVH